MDEVTTVSETVPDLKDIEVKIGRKTPEGLLRWMREEAGAHRGGDAKSAAAQEPKERDNTGKRSLDEKIRKLKVEMAHLRSVDVKILQQLLAVHEGIEAVRWVLEERSTLTSRCSSLTSSQYSLGEGPDTSWRGSWSSLQDPNDKLDNISIGSYLDTLADDMDEYCPSSSESVICSSAPVNSEATTGGGRTGGGGGPGAGAGAKAGGTGPGVGSGAGGGGGAGTGAKAGGTGPGVGSGAGGGGGAGTGAKAGSTGPGVGSGAGGGGGAGTGAKAGSTGAGGGTGPGVGSGAGGGGGAGTGAKAGSTGPGVGSGAGGGGGAGTGAKAGSTGAGGGTGPGVGSGAGGGGGAGTGAKAGSTGAGGGTGPGVGSGAGSGIGVKSGTTGAESVSGIGVKSGTTGAGSGSGIGVKTGPGTGAASAGTGAGNAGTGNSGVAVGNSSRSSPGKPAVPSSLQAKSQGPKEENPIWTKAPEAGKGSPGVKGSTKPQARKTTNGVLDKSARQTGGPDSTRACLNKLGKSQSPKVKPYKNGKIDLEGCKMNGKMHLEYDAHWRWVQSQDDVTFL